MTLNITDDLTESKRKSVISRGYRVTGYILERDGERCLIEKSAVRWINKDSFWNLMHSKIDFSRCLICPCKNRGRSDDE